MQLQSYFDETVSITPLYKENLLAGSYHLHQKEMETGQSIARDNTS